MDLLHLLRYAKDAEVTLSVFVHLVLFSLHSVTPMSSSKLLPLAESCTGKLHFQRVHATFKFLILAPTVNTVVAVENLQIALVV